MRIITLSSLIFGSLLPAALAGQLVAHDSSFAPDIILRVTLGNVPSACESRTDIVVNGTSPGPAIHIPPGKSNWIRVYNDMTDQNLTMHWHGLTQRLAPFADGTPLASQWPIPPGYFFDYEIAAEQDDAGTYYYHSHVMMQALSATGPIIVDDCGVSPYEYDDERIFHFQDYFSKSEQDMEKGIMGVPFKWTGETHGIALNGKGVAVGKTAVPGPPGGGRGFFGGRTGVTESDPFRGFGGHVGAHDGTGSGDSSDRVRVATSTECTLPVIDVDPGKTYRFRMIGATGLSFLSIGFEGHPNLTIVQIDGSEYNVPVTTDHIQLASGQRFDILFKTKTTEELVATFGNRSTFFIQFETLGRPQAYRGYAVLRYNQNVQVPAAPAAPPVNLPANYTDWLEYTFEPLFPEKNVAPTTEEVTRRIIIDCVQKYDDKTGQVVWEFNGLPWTEFTYDSPVLVDIYQRGEEAVPNYEACINNRGWDPKTQAFGCKVGEVLEIVLQNTGSLVTNGMAESHPFHAHSKHYYDIGSGPGKYDAEANNKRLAETGHRPVLRDTTMLFAYSNQVGPGEPAGWRAWRTRVTDAGVWMIHCHILAHMMMGMQSVWVMGNAEEIQKIPLTASQGYFTYGGSVYGNVTHSPTVYHYFDGTEKCGAPDKAKGVPS
ncbi:putative L-ascorbate oxidase [Podospora fimiseda]|uniref:L-ascorbate oxidase n=1 Tax=Podospora fimiseda TaxID=252190 RepID=A0AAN7BLX9_9PEZI|nr:putative L-ascorbate oxidase [Podospora fimiseda]